MNSDSNARAGTQGGYEVGVTVSLNYIDKVHTSLTKQWDGMSRSLTAQAVISLVTVAICVGAVTPREKFSVLGLGLSASITAILSGSAFLIAVFHAMALSALMRGMATKKALTRAYMALGYKNETLAPISAVRPFAESVEAPLAAATPIYTLLNLWMAEKQYPQSWLARGYEVVVGVTIFWGVAFLLPVVAELAVLWKVASFLEWWKNMWWAILIVPLVFSVASNVWTVATGASWGR